MPMINYPSPESYNPLGQLQQGIATGLSLGQRNRGKEPKPEEQSHAQIPDPGPKQEVNAGTLLQNEYQDILRYEDINKKIKKIKDLTPEKRQNLMQKAVQSGMIKTPIVQSIVLNDDVIDPDEVINIMKSVKNNQASSAFDIELLIDRLGGETSVGGGAIKTKLNEIQQTQNKINQQRAVLVKGTILNIEKVLDDYKYQKGGVPDPQTQKVINQWPEYMKEMLQYDPEWVQKHLEGVQSKRTGGYKPRATEFVGMTYDNMRVPITASSVDDYLNKAAAMGYDIDRTTVMGGGREGEMEKLRSTVNRKKRQKAEEEKNKPKEKSSWKFWE